MVAQRLVAIIVVVVAGFGYGCGDTTDPLASKSPSELKALAERNARYDLPKFAQRLGGVEWLSFSSGVPGVVELSPDGKKLAVLASGTYGATPTGTQIWDLETGKTVGPKELELTDPCDFVWSPNGTKFLIAHRINDPNISDSRGYVTSVGFTWTAEVWDAERLHPIMTLPVEDSPCRSVAWSADGRYLATAPRDGRVNVWEAPSGRPVMTIDEPAELVAITNKGSHLIVGNQSGIRMLSIPEGKLVRELPHKVHFFNDIALSPRGDIAAIGTKQGAVLWELSTGNTFEIPGEEKHSIGDVSFDQSGKRLALQEEDRPTKVFDVETREIVSTDLKANWASNISPDGTWVATARQRVRLASAETGKLIDRFPGHSIGIKAITITRDGRHAITLGFHEDVRLWDLGKREHLRRLLIDDNVMEFKLLDNEQLLAVRTVSATGVSVFRFPSFEPVSATPSAKFPDENYGFAGTGVILDEGNRVAYVDLPGNIRLWETKENREIDMIATALVNKPLHGKQMPVGLYLAPDSRTAARYFWNIDTIEIVDLQEKTVRCVIQVGIKRFFFLPVEFSNDSSRVLTSGESGVAEFDATSGKFLRVFPSPAQILAIALSPDGRYLAASEMAKEVDPDTNNYGQSIRVFDYNSGKSLTVLDTNLSWISALAFTPDGSKLLTGSQDSVLLIWDLQAALTEQAD